MRAFSSVSSSPPGFACEAFLGFPSSVESGSRIPLDYRLDIGGRPDATAPGMSFMGYMDRISGMTVYSIWQLLEGEQEMGTRDFLADLGYPYFRIPGIHDSARMHVAITDSMGKDHLYKPFYIALGYDATSGMEETVSRPAPVLLFPNPASSSFSWQSEIPVRAWEIYDISGKRIMQGDARQTWIDCRNWHEGVCIFVCIDIQGCTSSQKIIKKQMK